MKWRQDACRQNIDEVFLSRQLVGLLSVFNFTPRPSPADAGVISVLELFFFFFFYQKAGFEARHHLINTFLYDPS